MRLLVFVSFDLLMASLAMKKIERRRNNTVRALEVGS